MCDFIFGSDEYKAKARIDNNPFTTVTYFVCFVVGTVMQILTPDHYTYETISYRLEPGITSLQFKAKGCSDVYLGKKEHFW